MYLFLVFWELHNFKTIPLDFISTDMQKYVATHTEPASQLLTHIDRATHLNVMHPRMLAGHIQGRILAMFSHMIKPSSILEIGTYTGYSALCMAEGLQKNGTLITIDNNEELETRTLGYFKKSLYQSQIDYRIGDAMNVIPHLTTSFDLAFIDADKGSYQKYYDLILPKMTKGGFIIADNALWNGKVIAKAVKGDKDTVALQAFNQSVHTDRRVENVLLAVRDGLMILRVI